MSLRFPLLWELVNVVVIVAKGATFLVAGAPFKEAWLLLGLCAASIALELVSRVLPQPALGVGLACLRGGGRAGAAAYLWCATTEYAMHIVDDRESRTTAMPQMRRCCDCHS